MSLCMVVLRNDLVFCETAPKVFGFLLMFQSYVGGSAAVHSVQWNS